MGFKIAWMAVKGCTPAQAAEALGRELVAGQAWDIPDGDCVAELPGGWTLVWLDYFVELDRARFEPLLSFGPAVAVALTETVMFFEARGYEGGAEAWRITRNCEDDDGGVRSLVASGALPANFEAIRKDLETQQAADDRDNPDNGCDFICEIPIEVASYVCDFRHDEEPPAGVRFTPLTTRDRSAAGGRPGFLARLFGAR